MSLLHVIAAHDRTQIRLRTNDPAEISAELASHGVRFERWTAAADLPPGADQEVVLAAYRTDIDRVCADGGYRLVDVIRMRPDDSDPEWPGHANTLRERFLEEHRHGENEVRFFVEGSGCFYLHLDDHVFAVVCEAGDLLSVPRDTPHWFDMGARPQFTAIRFFEEEGGWLADFTGAPIASAIPYLDELVASTR